MSARLAHRRSVAEGARERVLSAPPNRLEALRATAVIALIRNEPASGPRGVIRALRAQKLDGYYLGLRHGALAAWVVAAVVEIVWRWLV